jgi:hypothetical protein
MTASDLRYRFNVRLALLAASAAAVVGFLTGDDIAAGGILVLWLIWTTLPATGGPPVLAMALTHHWMQNIIGVYYYQLTGREPIAMILSDYRPMVWMGLVSVAAIVVGIRVAHDLLLLRRPTWSFDKTKGIPWDYLLVAYFVAMFSKSGIERFAWTLAGFNQGLLALGYVRLGLFYILMRRLVAKEKYAYAAGLLLLEFAIGFTSFFAEFREPIMISIVVGWEHFDRRRVRDWLLIGTLSAGTVAAGILWMGIRSEVRYNVREGRAAASVTDRLRDVVGLASDFGNTSSTDKFSYADQLVDRLWDVYYPALAASRVPNVIPYENGRLLSRALQHIIKPRFLFPDKDPLESDSLLVRRYAGVYVAGPEQNTSIAFGYAIESYIDFGVPLMFLPIFAFGLFMGAGYHVLAYVIHDREVSIGAATVVFWLALAQTNREWARMLGLAGTLLIFVGGAALLMDIYLRSGNRRNPGAGAEEEVEFAAPQYL